MKLLVSFLLILQCSVYSRYISKRSLLGEHNHHHPSGVYLPPPAEVVTTTPAPTTVASVEVTEPEVVTTEAPAVQPAESEIVTEEATIEESAADVVDLKSDEQKEETLAIQPLDTYFVAEEDNNIIATEQKVATETELKVVEIEQ